jgi:hypothetical protein
MAKVVATEASYFGASLIAEGMGALKRVWHTLHRVPRAT